MQRIAAFRGAVSCRPAPCGPPALTLAGETAEHPGERLAVTLTLSAAAPAQLPATLSDALLERIAPGEYRLGSGARSWPIAARALHLHRDVATAFYRAIPPRPAPRLRRLYFTVVLGMAASRAGLALLRALRR